jgi:hypothetical protein
LLNIDAQAQAIVDRLREFSDWNMVTYLEQDDKEASGTPVKMPCLHVILDNESFVIHGNKRITAQPEWLIIVRAKAVPGKTGMLALVDLVLDALDGFRPVEEQKPLEPKNIQYLRQYGEATAYAVTFGASQTITKNCGV